MLTYTNRLKKLILPEYGRNIQNMVDYCTAIEDRDERNICAATIVDAMQTLFPATGDAEEYRRKLWDHLAIMSNFMLDVDYPYELVDRRVFGDKPDPCRPNARVRSPTATTAGSYRALSTRHRQWSPARSATPLSHWSPTR